MTRQHQYVSIQEAARALSKSDKTLRRWIASGKIASKRINGRILVQVDMTPAPSLEERVAALEEKVARLDDEMVTLKRQPRPLRKLGNVPR